MGWTQPKRVENKSGHSAERRAQVAGCEASTLRDGRQMLPELLHTATMEAKIVIDVVVVVATVIVAAVRAVVAAATAAVVVAASVVVAAAVVAIVVS